MLDRFLHYKTIVKLMSYTLVSRSF